MATIIKRQTKSGISCQAKIRIKGVPPVSKSFTRLTDAKRWAFKYGVQAPGREYSETIEARKHTGKELIDRYILEELPGKKDARNRKRQLEIWKREIAPCLTKTSYGGGSFTICHLLGLLTGHAKPPDCPPPKYHLRAQNPAKTGTGERCPQAATRRVAPSLHTPRCLKLIPNSLVRDRFPGQPISRRWLQDSRIRMGTPARGREMSPGFRVPRDWNHRSGGSPKLTYIKPFSTNFR